ncbi:linear amide C-N hydrolase [Aquitalea pelogenes]|uniref:linear amide C-N hydrolase n=1 Tax=Aquitalea pelogenes TaxID=1293573 RepID=UPI000695E865|nr:linear amide C-N hydrolase [Aquitalea pelogenes]
MCTTFMLTDQHGNAYQGRTLEFGQELDFVLSYYPRGTAFNGQVPPGFAATHYVAEHAFLSIDLRLSAERMPAVAGINDAGLSVNMNMFAETTLPTPQQQDSRTLIAVSEVGSWLLARCADCEEVRQLVSQSRFWVDPLPSLDNTPAPFHYAVFDAQARGLVIEFDRGQAVVHDNPVGVMTNGPAFDWHLTNLDNYAHVSNLGKREQRFGQHLARTEDVGNALAGLPADDTSTGRFVRAAYYVQFCRTPQSADEAIALVAKIANKFDRPRGASNLVDAGSGQIEEEWTTFTTLTDLSRRRLLIRPDDAVNYLQLALDDFSDCHAVRRQDFGPFLRQNISLSQPRL